MLPRWPSIFDVVRASLSGTTINREIEWNQRVSKSRFQRSESRPDHKPSVRYAALGFFSLRGGSSQPARKMPILVRQLSFAQSPMFGVQDLLIVQDLVIEIWQSRQPSSALS